MIKRKNSQWFQLKRKVPFFYSLFVVAYNIEDEMAELENMMSKITLETYELLTGSEWRGMLIYPDTKEEYPMILTVIKQNKKSIEGMKLIRFYLRFSIKI